jgi:DNA topoisomerase-1
MAEEATAPNGRGPGLHRTERPGPRRWVTDTGDAVTDGAVLDRLRRLAVPPAWTGVWASADPDAPVQATGTVGRPR